MAQLTYHIELGALSRDPSEQCSDQGLFLANGPFHDKDAHALARLSVRCILSAEESARARKRLMKNINKDVSALV